MDFVQRVQRGDVGVRFAVPREFEIQRVQEHDAGLFDAARELGWHLSTYDLRLDLQPAHQALLARDVERHTRDLFEMYSLGFPRPPGARPPERLRTADAAWSPVVSLEPVTIDGAAALTVIHRLAYEPGYEVLMGHLLVPTRTGLFEVRVIAQSRMTGVRESTLLGEALARAPGESPGAVMARLGNKHYDDPAHDPQFPDHPLSRIRAALGWLLRDAGLAVTDPAREPARGEVVLPSVRGAITPPPRYLPVGEFDPARAFVQFARVSFAGTDGVQYLSVVRQETRVHNLASFAERMARAAVPEGAGNVRVEAALLAGDAGRARGEARFADATGSRRNAWHWIADARGAVTAFVLSAPQCVPREELFADLDAVVRSWHPMG